MSLLFMDGFDHYQTADILRKWTSKSYSSVPNISTTAGRRGGGALALTGTQDIIKAIPFTSTIIVGFAMYPEGSANTPGIIIFNWGSTVQCALRRGSDGRILFYRGWSTPFIAGSAAGVIQENVWSYLEVKITFSNTVGSIEVRLNGQTVLTSSGHDNCDSATELCSSIRVGYNGVIADVYMDDMYICDTNGTINNDFLGDCRVDALLPTSDGAVQEWTPSTGVDNYATVDEALYSAVDYVSVDATNKTDTYGYGDVPVAGEVFGVQINTAAVKMDAGSAEIKNVARVASTNYLSSALALSDTSTYKSTILEKNPNTDAQWSKAEVDAAEFGVNRV